MSANRALRSVRSRFATPSELGRMRYVFRNQPPMSVESTLRTRLDNLLNREGASDAVRQDMLHAFDCQVDTVQSPVVQRTGGVPAPLHDVVVGEGALFLLLREDRATALVDLASPERCGV